LGQLVAPVVIVGLRGVINFHALLSSRF
jgi:hypothetical protein